MRHYYLDEQRRVCWTRDVTEWARLADRSRNRVGDTDISGIRVSTVFLGLDHRFSGDGPPILWETMLFGGDNYLDWDCRRCSGTFEQAEEQHRTVCREVEAALGIEHQPESSETPFSDDDSG